MTHPLTTWTPEEDAILKDGIINGRSYSEIARALKTRSRNSAIGRASRLGIHDLAQKPALRAPEVKRDLYTGLSGTQIKERAHKKAAPPATVFLGTSSAAGSEANLKRRAELTVSGRAMVAKMGAEAANDTATPLVGRSHFQCAWPVGEPEQPRDQLCCGQRTTTNEDGESVSYCAEHFPRATNGKPKVKGVSREYARPGERRRVASVWDGGRAA